VNTLSSRLRKVEDTAEVWHTAAFALQELSRRQPKDDSFVYRMRRLLRVVMPEGEDIEERRQAIASELAMRDDSGKPVFAAPGQMAISDPPELNRRVKELFSTRVELTFEPLRPEELKAQGIKLTGDLAYRLGPLLLDPEVGPEGVAEEAALIAEPT
jgi:hypothetical protein